MGPAAHAQEITSGVPPVVTIAPQLATGVDAILKQAPAVNAREIVIGAHSAIRNAVRDAIGANATTIQAAVVALTVGLEPVIAPLQFPMILENSTLPVQA